MLCCRLLALALVAMWPSHRAALAQFGAPTADTQGVVGVGRVVLDRPAEMLRLRVDVLATGKDIDEAVERLEARRTLVEKELARLGAVKGSARFGAPQIDSATSQQSQQMEAMLRERLSNGGRGPSAEEEAPKPPVRVSMTLSAAWPLSGGTPGELLAESEKLIARIKKADLGGAKEATALSPEQEELLEEMEGQYNGYSEYGERTPGEPLFFYAAAVSEEEYAAALAEAFQKARAKAARLAQAAGAQLGPLQAVGPASGDDPFNSSYEYDGQNQVLYQAMQLISAESAAESTADERREAVGDSPASVTATVSISATFALDHDQAGAAEE